ncbi:MAG: Unknown protein [uncultured Aureispira sp.]|uniref:Uncharacterized protein n=1 Tax=uncultured Aureispira sp. TaxID=1331704 RepID=A0A6S6TZH2_9BACT|nr:MAG: Unknown protein [uncultured Aureispira sp.]
MKRFFYLLFTFLLLFSGITIYQYIQYEEELDGLKATDSQVSRAIPVDTIAHEHPPAASYYVHHQRLSTIARYNPLLRATIQRKLHFYDYAKQNMVLLDFYNLLNYREQLLVRASPRERKKIEQQIQEYSEQLCTRWEVFAQHLKQTYPNMPEAAELNNLCATSVIRNYKQADIISWMVDSIKR